MAMNVRQVSSSMRRLWDDALRNWVASMAYPPIFECHTKTAPKFVIRKPSRRSNPSAGPDAASQIDPRAPKR